MHNSDLEGEGGVFLDLVVERDRAWVVQLQECFSDFFSHFGPTPSHESLRT